MYVKLHIPKSMNTADLKQAQAYIKRVGVIASLPFETSLYSMKY